MSSERQVEKGRGAPWKQLMNLGPVSDHYLAIHVLSARKKGLNAGRTKYICPRDRQTYENSESWRFHLWGAQKWQILDWEVEVGVLRLNINISVGCLTQQRFIDWSPAEAAIYCTELRKYLKPLIHHLKNLIAWQIKIKTLRFAGMIFKCSKA